MKSTTTSIALFVSAAIAHSAVWSIEIDGIKYVQIFQRVLYIIMLANADITIVIQPVMYEWMQSWEPNVLSGLSRTRVLWLLSKAWMIQHLPVSISLHSQL